MFSFLSDYSVHMIICSYDLCPHSYLYALGKDYVDIDRAVRNNIQLLTNEALDMM